VANDRFERGIPSDLAARVARHEVEPPDLSLVLVANRGDSITVQVVDGSPPRPGGFIDVKARGLYEIARAEEWPAVAGGNGPRLLLTLRAFPAT